VTGELAAGFVAALAPLNLGMILLGLTVGVVAGALPGVTMLNAVVLVLPFTYLMGIVPSLLLLAAIYAGGVFGGSITGILFNIPGDPMSVPTTWEGYALNRQGQVRLALGMAIMSSAIGGVLSALTLMFAAPPIARIALSFSTVEYFAVVLFGMASVVVLGTRSLPSALMSLFVGVLLGTVGSDPQYGVPRFAFGLSILSDGIDFVVVLIGLFAIGEILEQVTTRGPAAPGAPAAGRVEGRPRLPTLRELWTYRWSLLRGTGVGILIGVIPGAGATVSSFVSYGFERQFAREPERFGKGSLEGLSAAESSVNGSTGGAMIPLLTLGIPGSGATAVMMGAFLLHGVQPGPLLFRNSADEVYTIFAGFLIANVLMVAVGFAAARGFAYLMRVPAAVLSALICALCFLGAFALRNNMGDVWLTMAFGAAGFFMRRFALPIPPLVLGLILGPLGEQYFMTSMASSGNDLAVFLTRPVSAALVLFSVALLAWPVLQRRRRRARLAAVASALLFASGCVLLVR
jgi:putative tricarboxylic transport membrane protein